MLTILFPQSKKRQIQQDDFVESKTLFESIFRDNNEPLRCKFFREPLIKHLWGKIFVTECEEIIKSYLRSIRGQAEEGEIKFMRLFKKMLQHEEQNNFQMLPLSARNPHNLKVFNKEEEAEYLAQNSKYNKRYRKQQQMIIERI